MNLNGIHHITAVTSQIQPNLEFYTRVLGLRLVKKTVNQDDISAYHVFYADKAGTPGTDLTFFDWPNIGPNQRGTDSITGPAFRVPGQAGLDFWAERLRSQGAAPLERTTFAGREILRFEDPEGQRLYLVNDQGAPYEGEIWERPDIPKEHALRGFYSVILSIPDLDRLAPVLTEALAFEEREQEVWLDGSTPTVIYTTTPTGGPGSEVWLLEEPDAPRARLGAGGVHHVAFRTEDLAEEKTWRERLNRAGLRVTKPIDRFWFQSIYFRVSRGILFEIATDGPGFGIDEDPEKLGQKLVLPPFLESQRARIEETLVPIEE